MKRRLLLLPVVLCLANLSALWAQISNTATTITLNSGVPKPERVCPWNNLPSSSPSNGYKMYVYYEDFANYGVTKRFPLITHPDTFRTCTITNLGPTSNPENEMAPNLLITIDTIGFPETTPNGYDFSFTKGTIFIKDTITGQTYHQTWEYTQYTCNPLPIYIASFTFTNFSNHLKFDWTAVDESDYLSHYVLQRSSNNAVWYDDVLEPAQTGLGSHNYTVYANKPGYPWMWYRLKWIGEYGYIRHSPSIQVFNTGSTATNVVCNYTNISGSSSACAPVSKVYKIHNVPASAGAYTWSVTGGSVTSTDQNGMKANVSFSSPGNATVYANSANNSCNKSKPVTVGGTGYLSISGTYTAYNSYTYHTLTVNNLWPGTTGSQYNWYLGETYVGSGQSWSFNVYPGLCQSVTCSVTTSCGVVSGYYYICWVEPPPCDPWCEPCIPCDDPWDPKIGVTPVPAKDQITLTMQPADLKSVKIGKQPAASPRVFTVQLYDLSGNLRLERNGVTLEAPLRLDVGRLPVGNYILQIKSGSRKISKQIRIQR